jgi:hypothetical protein
MEGAELGFAPDAGDPTQPPTDSKKPHYGSGAEALAVRRELGDFAPDNSRAATAIRHAFGTLKLRELKAVVQVVQDILQRRHGIPLPKLTRTAKRSHQLLVKYINEHYDVMIPVFQSIRLLNRDRQPVRERNPAG